MLECLPFPLVSVIFIYESNPLTGIQKSRFFFKLMIGYAIAQVVSCLFHTMAAYV
jgi:hypothetical protein